MNLSKIYVIILSICTIVILSNINLSAATRLDKLESKYNDLAHYINIGVKDVLKDINYEDMVEVCKRLRKGGFKDSANYLEGMVSKNSANTLASFGGGLENSDPRVQMICIDVLKYCQLDAKHVRYINHLIEKHSGKKSVTRYDSDEYIEYMDFFGFTQKKHLIEELVRLKKWILRRLIVQNIYNGDPTAIEKLSREEFSVLIEPIEGEDAKRVPILAYIEGKRNYFNNEDLPIFISAVTNSTVVTVKEGCSRFLIAFYNRNLGKMSKALRNEILGAIKAAYDDGVIDKPALKDRPNIFDKHGESAYSKLKKHNLNVEPKTDSNTEE